MRPVNQHAVGRTSANAQQACSIGPYRKALQINLDGSKHGTFAEIGAGQEVVRWFFRVGGAAGTIARAISAYDMKFSDAIYGPCERYVSRQRLQAMLDHEYGLLIERLDESRGTNTTFFVFANTVAARSYTRQEDTHGWVGVKFQTHPRAEPCQIILHVRLLDKENVQEQEALGILGVNLMYAALYHHDQPARVIAMLLDDLSVERIEVDVFKLIGPGFEKLDNRLMALQLVEQGLTRAAMFTADGDTVQPAEVMYKRPVLIERGSFRPVTRLHVDLLECARRQFRKDRGANGEEPVAVMEMTLRNLLAEEKPDHTDFLARADMLSTQGNLVLISNYGQYYRLAEYLSEFTKGMPILIALGVPGLQELFDEKYYDDLRGGILEAFGRLFTEGVTLYVYPVKEQNTGALTTAENLPLAQHLRSLYAYLRENGFIKALTDFDEQCLGISARDVLAKIQRGDPRWEADVPATAADLIKRHHLFGLSNRTAY